MQRTSFGQKLAMVVAMVLLHKPGKSSILNALAFPCALCNSILCLMANVPLSPTFSLPNPECVSWKDTLTWPNPVALCKQHVAATSQQPGEASRPAPSCNFRANKGNFAHQLPRQPFNVSRAVKSQGHRDLHYKAASFRGWNDRNEFICWLWQFLIACVGFHCGCPCTSTSPSSMTDIQPVSSSKCTPITRHYSLSEQSTN